MQANPLQTPEDKLSWTIERLKWIQNLTALARGENISLDVVLTEVDELLSELESGQMVDRGVVD